MIPSFQFRPKEIPVVMQLIGALQDTLDINQALRAAYPLLCQLVPADHGSMCISRAEDPTRYDWSVAEMPEGFFREYAEVAHHDFVRLAVARKPNVVICDADMLPPSERTHVDRHPMVQYMRANDMRIEQIMAVMISNQPMWNGGLTLYRDRRRAFSPRESAILQELLPFFAKAMANCKRYGSLLHWSKVMEEAFHSYGTSVLLLSTSKEWVNATNGIEHAFDRCFGKKNRGPDGLPPLLSAEISKLGCGLPIVAPPAPWIPPVSGAGVIVTFQPVIKEFGVYWMVLLEEVPERWRELLTKTEIDVALRVAQGWDNQLIADGFGTSPATVRTQVYNIFNKLGVDRREMLIAQFRSRK